MKLNVLLRLTRFKTYKQAVRGLFTTGTSNIQLVSQVDLIVAKRNLNRPGATAVKGKRSLVKRGLKSAALRQY